MGWFPNLPHGFEGGASVPITGRSSATEADGNGSETTPADDCDPGNSRGRTNGGD
jgi:hypothetical protein